MYRRTVDNCNVVNVVAFTRVNESKCRYEGRFDSEEGERFPQRRNVEKWLLMKLNSRVHSDESDEMRKNKET